MLGICFILMIFNGCLGDFEKTNVEDKAGGTKKLADAHNHIHGILPVDAINVMLTNAKEHWLDNENKFDNIPNFLVKDAENLDFKGCSNKRGANRKFERLNSLDIFCRIIVFSIFDIENEGKEGYIRKSNDLYCSEVKKMLLMDSEDSSGMNSAGLLLSGCISLRCIMDHHSSKYRRDPQYLTELISKIDGKDDLKTLFKKACLVNHGNGTTISKDEWLFEEVERCNLDIMRSKEMEGSRRVSKFIKDADYLSKLAITSSLSCSLWTPFNDSFTMRSLLRVGVNRNIWIILSIKWLLENEVKDSNYLMEITEKVGNLEGILSESLQEERLEKFGLLRSPPQLDRENYDEIKYAPLLIKSKDKKGILYLRFLSGIKNDTLKKVDCENKMDEIGKAISNDSKCSCWAGVDFMSAENLKYSNGNFEKLLTFLYGKLIEAKDSESRNLWFRPHIGHGFSGEANFERKKYFFFFNKKSLVLGLGGFFGVVKSLNDKRKINELMEFIYRSFFHDWFLAYSLKCDKTFSIKCFRENIEGPPLFYLKESIKTDKAICSSNFIKILAWMNGCEDEHNCWQSSKKPKIRLVNATHLFFNDAAVMNNIEPEKRNRMWLDLNFRSDMISSVLLLRYIDDKKLKRNFLQKNSEIEESLKTISDFPFTSAPDQTRLVASSGILGELIKKVIELKIKFVLGTDGQGVKSTRIESEISNFRKAVSMEEEKGIEFEAIRENNFKEYFSYCLGDLFHVNTSIDAITLKSYKGSENEGSSSMQAASLSTNESAERRQHHNTSPAFSLILSEGMKKARVNLSQENKDMMEGIEYDNSSSDKSEKEEDRVILDVDITQDVSVQYMREVVRGKKKVILKKLIENKVRTESSEEYPLHCAIGCGDVSICKFILEEEAKASEKNEKIKNPSIHKKNSEGLTPFELAMKEMEVSRKEQIIKMLIESLNEESFVALIDSLSDSALNDDEERAKLITDILNEFNIKEREEWSEQFKESLKRVEGNEEKFDEFITKYKEYFQNIRTMIEQGRWTLRESREDVKVEFKELKDIRKQIYELDDENINFSSAFGSCDSASIKNKFRDDILVDAHNHLYGILPIEVIQSMLSNAYEHWEDSEVIDGKGSEKGRFASIPTTLVKGAESILPLKGRFKWLNSLDVLCRIIVFSIVDIDNNKSMHSNSKYKDKVKDMIYEHGRGVNSAGILLSGCISLRVLIDFHFKTLKRRTDYFYKFRNYMNKETRKFSELFKVACLLDYEEGANNNLRKDNWLFTKIRDIQMRDEHVEWIAEAAVTSALSSSLWVPFDDCYALRGLLRVDKPPTNTEQNRSTGRINETNFIMLTLKWLMESEARGLNYFAEISIKLGQLKKTLEIICGKERTKKRHANDEDDEFVYFSTLSKFGFEAVEIESLKKEKDYPLVLVYKEGNYKEKVLCLRFLTGFVNSSLWEFDYKFSKEQAKNIERDAGYSCWAGIDMYGMENFSYGEKFKLWLNLACDKLTEISKRNDQKRNLWLRPHVGEGSWVMEKREKRKECFRPRFSELDSDYFDKGIFWLLQNESVTSLYRKHIYEILEFIYRSIFTEWFPFFSLNYGKREFELRGLGEAMPNVPNRKIFSQDGERMGATNIGIIVEWIKNRESKVPDRYHPRIRFGHATHLNNDVLRKMEELEKLSKDTKAKVWVDLNFGSNVVTAANAINSVLRGKANDQRGDHGINIEEEIKAILSAPFTSSQEQTCLVARSSEIANYIRKLSDLGIGFVLGTDGQGAETTSIWTEKDHFVKACGIFEDGDEFVKSLSANTQLYLMYGTQNLKPNFERE